MALVAAAAAAATETVAPHSPLRASHLASHLLYSVHQICCSGSIPLWRKSVSSSSPNTPSRSQTCTAREKEPTEALMKVLDEALMTIQ